MGADPAMFQIWIECIIFGVCKQSFLPFFRMMKIFFVFHGVRADAINAVGIIDQFVIPIRRTEGNLRHAAE